MLWNVERLRDTPALVDAQEPAESLAQPSAHAERHYRDVVLLHDGEHGTVWTAVNDAGERVVLRERPSTVRDEAHDVAVAGVRAAQQARLAKPGARRFGVGALVLAAVVGAVLAGGAAWLSRSSAATATSAQAAVAPKTAVVEPARPPVEVTPTTHSEPIAGPGRGRLALTSNPIGADVWIDGHLTGFKTPVAKANAFELPAGLHHVELTSGDRHSQVYDVVIAEGQFSIVRATIP